MRIPASWIRFAVLTVVAVSALAALKLLVPGAAFVAHVRKVAGSVQRATHGAWSTARAGDGLVLGDSVQTGAASRASVVLLDGSAIELDPETLVRFTANAQREQRIRVDTGLAVLESTGQGVCVSTELGEVRVAPRSRVHMALDDHGLRMEVKFGRASFVDANDSAQLLATGDELIATRGQERLIVQRAQRGEKPSAAPPMLASNQLVEVPPPEPEVLEPVVIQSEVAKQDAPARPSLEPPRRADVTLPAGERATVHRAGPGPTYLRLRLGDTCNGRAASIEIAKHHHRFHAIEGTARAPIFPAYPGATQYRVHCVNEPFKVAATGRVRVLRDAAVRRVPLKAPENPVDLDGHPYTVLYQNRLPAVVARYARLPANAPARVVVKTGPRIRRFEGKGSVRIASGQLEDGEHVMFLESLDGRVRSPMTTLRITFDNAAPSASLDQRGVLARDAQGRTHLSGIVPQGARVSLAGQALNVDQTGRFAVEAIVDDTDATLALRVEHPRAGLHYYVRQVGEVDAP